MKASPRAGRELRNVGVVFTISLQRHRFRRGRDQNHAGQFGSPAKKPIYNTGLEVRP